MTSNILLNFEKKVLNGLLSCGVNLSSMKDNKEVMGAAISGGADSLSLLYSLCNILHPFNIPLEVITVNHLIRPENETTGDAIFVLNTCNTLKEKGYNVTCSIVTLKKGEVEELSKINKAGIEEAARSLRYNAFTSFINEKKLSYLSLAHNKNDQVETILMRFLQGSNSDSSGGIKQTRDKYIRPLLNITRSEIEEYLKDQELSWCEDKTNNDTAYYRNNVRHNLIPFLSKYFPGFDKAILNGALKASEDSEIIKDIVDSFPLIKENDYIVIKKDNFLKMHRGVQKRILLKACNMVGEEKRIPDIFLNDVLASLSNSPIDKTFSKIINSVEIKIKKENLFIKKYIKKDTDLVFFDIIEENGNYNFPFGKLSVTFSNGHMFASINGCNSVINCTYPFCIRNARQGDEIQNNEGVMKKVSDIFSNWHVDNSLRKLIPVVYQIDEGSENIKAILSSFLGYKDWIVK